MSKIVNLTRPLVSREELLIVLKIKYHQKKTEILKCRPNKFRKIFLTYLEHFLKDYFLTLNDVSNEDHKFKSKSMVDSWKFNRSYLLVVIDSRINIEKWNLLFLEHSMNYMNHCIKKLFK